MWRSTSGSGSPTGSGEDPNQNNNNNNNKNNHKPAKEKTKTIDYGNENWTEAKKPLHWASFFGDVKQIEKLLKSGKHHIDEYRAKPIWFVKSKNPALRVGYIPMPGRKKTCTALHIASEEGYEEVVKTLLRHGADPLLKTVDTHETAIQIAKRAKHPELAQLMAAHCGLLTVSSEIIEPGDNNNAAMLLNKSFSDSSLSGSDIEPEFKNLSVSDSAENLMKNKESPKSSNNNNNNNNNLDSDRSDLTASKEDADVDLIKSELERLKEKELCIICMKEEIDTVLLECGHSSICSFCSSGLKTCPICRANILRVVKIFKATL